MFTSKHSLSPSSVQQQAQSVLFALGALAPGAGDRIRDLHLEDKISAAIQGGTGASSPFNRAQFGAMNVKVSLHELRSVLPQMPGGLQGKDNLDGYLAGVIYGTAREEVSRRDLPRDLAIAERGRDGRDVSSEISKATLLVYNFLVSSDGRSMGSAVQTPKDQDQVIKSFSQLIAANITSDRELFAGAFHAAQALNDHLSRRALIFESERLRAVLTGIIVSAFKPDTETAALPERHAAAVTPVSAISALSMPRVVPASEGRGEEASRPADSAPARAEVARNTSHLSKEQCTFLSRLLSAVVDHTENLDTDLERGRLGQVSQASYAALGRRIHELVRSGATLNQLECVQAVAEQFAKRSTTEGLSAEQLQLVASVTDLAWKAIVEDVCCDLPHRFLNTFSAGTLRELVEDRIAQLEDPLASVADYEPLDSKHLNAHLSMVDCVQAMAFRLRAIAEHL